MLDVIGGLHRDRSSGPLMRGERINSKKQTKIVRVRGDGLIKGSAHHALSCPPSSESLCGHGFSHGFEKVVALSSSLPPNTPNPNPVRSQGLLERCLESVGEG